MRSWLGFSILSAFLVSVLPVPSVQADEARDDLAEIVRLLGYGGGIHNFKNYVLRDRPEYHTDARENFTRILEKIASLERGAEFTAAEEQALNAVLSVVESYNAGLDRVTELRNKGWRIEDIDRAVIIDDTAAVKGLDTLRAKWIWTNLEEIEFQLGYGKAIHNFKNYVLRGHEQYHTEALKNFLAVEALLASQIGQPELSSPQAAAQTLVKASGAMDPADMAAYDKTVQEITRLFRESRVALENVERTARAYRDHLGLIERLIASQRSVRQIDLAVKINDWPAKTGLAQLRGQHIDISAQLSKP